MTELEHYVRSNSFKKIGTGTSYFCASAYVVENKKTCYGVSCNNCEFRGNTKKILKTLLSEHKDKPQLTDDEKAILRNIDPIYEYIVRNKYGDLVVYVDKPYKGECQWCSLTDIRLFSIFNHLFQFIKWEDEEPWFIPDLLEE